MVFTSVDHASNYIRDNLQAFYNNSRLLRDRLLVIGRLLQTAKQKGDQATMGKLLVLQQQTKDTFTEQLALEQKLAPFAEYFKVNQTLGALPIILGLAAVSIAGGLYVLNEKIKLQGKGLDLIAQGKMSPSELAAATDGSLVSFGGGLGLGMPLALVGVALFVFMGGLNLRGVLK